MTAPPDATRMDRWLARWKDARRYFVFNAFDTELPDTAAAQRRVKEWIDRLRDECPVALAVSLHAPNDALRDRLVPINRRHPLAELMAACQRYLEKAPRDFITFEYVMLDGVNDTDAHARELVGIARRVRCKFNLIPFNPFPNASFRRSPPERIRSFAEILRAAGLTATVRKTRSGCGMRPATLRRSLHTPAMFFAAQPF